MYFWREHGEAVKDWLYVTFAIACGIELARAIQWTARFVVGVAIALMGVIR